MKLNRPWILLFAGSVVAGGIVIACQGDDPAPIAASNTTDAGTDASSTGDGSLDDPDADVPVEGEGELPPEEDGGVTDPDGGFDAGPACASVAYGSYVKSTCAGLASRLAGGALVTATYQLTAVRTYGAGGFCDGGGYADFDHRGGLDVTATSTTAATFEFLDQYKRSNVFGPIIPRPSTLRYDVAASATSASLALTPQACALTAAPASGSYATGVTTKTGKRYFILRIASGKGSTDYRYDEP